MAYQVDRFNGTFLTSVDDGTIDTTTDLRLVGKNYAGYGEVQNENFLHLLESFANTTAPPKAIGGQVWYDSGTRKLKFYDKPNDSVVGRWKVASGAEVSSTAPSGLQTGDFWFDTSVDQLRVWNGERYVIIGPEIPDDLAATAVQPVIVKDNLDQNHPILKVSSGSDVVFIVSKDDDFTLNSTVNPITGFSFIKKGITLVNTTPSTGVTTTAHRYWGTASNALRLGGFEASQFVRFGEVSFDEEVAFKDSGFTVGDQNDLRIRVENGDEPVIENRLGNAITIRIRISDSDQRSIAIFSGTGIAPGTDNVYNIGGPISRYANVYASTFLGNLTGNVTGTTTGQHFGNIRATDNTLMFDSTAKIFYGQFGAPGPTNQASFYGALIGDVTGTASNAIRLNSLNGEQAALPTSIAVRDSSGNLTANRFIGIADKADRIKIDDSATDTDPSYKTAKTTASNLTIAARDGSGDLRANYFRGTATAAQYADLAEKYLTDRDYDAGTVVAIGGEKEVRSSVKGDRAIGVVSTNPAILMNSDLIGGTYIALKGRVPVKIKGKVQKGDRLIAVDDGCAAQADVHTFTDVFAVSLESNASDDIKLVECVIL